MLDNFEYEVTEVKSTMTTHSKYLFEDLGGSYQVSVEHTITAEDGHPQTIKTSNVLSSSYQKALRAFFAEADKQAEKEKLSA